MVTLLAALAFAAEPSTPTDPVADDLAAIDATPGTAVWDRAVAFHLLLAYDRDRSGAIDRRREVDAVPCAVWVGLDTALAERSEYPGLYATYGFPDDLVWLGHFLGLSHRVRAHAAAKMQACGLVAEGPSTSPKVDPQMQEFVTGMMLGIPEPGSPLWLERVRLILLLTYDADDSGWLDTAPELRTVACSVWQAMDGALIEAGEGGLVDLVGLRTDLPYGGDLLGIAPDVAPTAYEAARRCGLQDAW